MEQSGPGCSVEVSRGSCESHSQRKVGHLPEKGEHVQKTEGRQPGAADGQLRASVLPP